jgi:hypothetical protein
VRLLFIVKYFFVNAELHGNKRAIRHEERSDTNVEGEETVGLDFLLESMH